MRVLHSKKFLVLLAGAVVAGIVAAVAVPAIVSRQIIATGHDLRYEFTKTSAVDFDSGWHLHPGIVILQVQEGSFQIYQGSCTPKTVSAGDTYIEVPYEPVRAIAKGKITWTVSVFTNDGDPPLIPQPNYNPCPGIG